MAVSGRQCNWFGFAYIIVFGGALAICVWNKIKGMDELGDKEKLADAFTTATTVIAAVTFAAVGIELVMRSSMSAFLVYPCEFQKRTFCCFDYTMPSFWLMCVILTALNLVVSAALTVLIIIMVGLDSETENAVKIVRMVVVVGISAVQLVFAAISFKMSKACFLKEKAEEEVDMFEEETIPLEPIEDDLDMSMNIPKSPMVRSPMLGESPIPRSPLPPGTPSHRVAMENMQPEISSRYKAQPPPASPYAINAIKNSGNVGRYSPTVRTGRY